jgi:hypothetical protein
MSVDRFQCVVMGVLLCGTVIISSEAQEVEPRRWSHLPIDSNLVGGGYAYTSGEIGFDPVLLIEDGDVDMHTGVFKYIRTFEWFDRSARFDFTQA